MQRLQDAATRPVTCTVCGSEWFYEVTLQQYANMYSSTPGGDMHPIGQMNHQVRICPCGQPYRPNIGGVRAGRTGNESVVGVMAALENAIQLRAQVPAMIQKLAQDLVSREELMAVVASLAERLDSLERPAVTDTVSQPTAPAKPSSKKASKDKSVEPAPTEANG